MTRSRPHRNPTPPRYRAVHVPALAAGFLVVLIALVVVLYGDISRFASELLVENGSEEVTGETLDTNNEPEESAPEPAQLGQQTYIEGDVGFPETLNPLLAQTTSEEAVSAMLYRQLLGTSADGEPEPDLAIDWTVSDDGLTHTIELDPNARWHDGQPITVADVLFTISLVKDPEFPGDPSLPRFWRAITANQTDELTIEFTLLEPYVGFASYLRLPILPKHKFAGIMASDLVESDISSERTGSTDFKLEHVDRDASEIRFVRASDEHEGGFDEVTFRYFDSRDEMIAALGEGEIDGIAYLPLSALSNEELADSNAEIYSAEMAGYTALFFNLRHPYLREAQTRQAIEHAIDRESLIANVLGGHASAGSSPIPVMFSAFEPVPERGYDVDMARQQLNDAGWTIEDGEEIRQRDGEYLVIPLIVNSDDPQRMAVASELQEQLRRVGIAIDVQALPSIEVQRSLDTRQYTAALYGWHTDNGNLDCFQMWHSSQIEDGSNFTGFANAEADELLLAARRSATMAERNTYYSGFQQIFAEQVPAVVLFYPRYHFAVSDRVEGAEPGPLVSLGDRVRQIPKWYVQ